MSRNVETKPVLLTQIRQPNEPLQQITLATGNEDKIREFERILGLAVISALSADNEIQGTPEEVIKQKAKDAWERNGHNPVFVEDTSLSIPSLGLINPSYVAEWAKNRTHREAVCDYLTKVGGTRDATAMVHIGIFDGKDHYKARGLTNGKIALTPQGPNLFDWDDIFIPDGQEGEERTFAQMTDEEKDSLSMRRKAIEDLKRKLDSGEIVLRRYTRQLMEPDDHEMERIRYEELLGNDAALRFAFALEAVEEINPPNRELIADRTKDVVFEDGTYFSRYTTNPDSPSIGLIMTTIEEARVEKESNGLPVIYQMGPERRKLAIAQRIAYFNEVQSDAVHQRISDIENGRIDFPTRSNAPIPQVEELLGFRDGHATKAGQFKELAYAVSSSTEGVSRRHATRYGTSIKKIGKYPREQIGLGSMVTVSGQRDAIVTAAIGHMFAFVTRNGPLVDVDRQIALIKASQNTIREIFGEDELRIARAERNIGVALGCANPQETLDRAKKIYEDTGVNLFRIYTISHDPQVIETARLLRSYFNSIDVDMELVVGKVSDEKQADLLIQDDIQTDVLDSGHGGGRQCSSPENAMGVTNMEVLYNLTRNPKFNSVSIIVEGGVGHSTVIPLLIGADCVLYSNQLFRGTVECGDLFVKDKNGKMVQPYPGSASATTMLIESTFPELKGKRTGPDGHAITEGKAGFMVGERKAPSAAIYIREFRGNISKAYADLGVKSAEEFEDLRQDVHNILRILTPDAKEVASTYGSPAS
jgi:XTP/dITP diphosphohydrolase